MRAVILIALGLAVLTLSGCRNQSWHQKLTLIVETPSGEVTGASVVEVNFSGANNIFLADLDASSQSLRGEDAMVEVLPGRWLFALLNDHDVLIYDRVKKSGQGYEATIPAIRAQRTPLEIFAQEKSTVGYVARYPMLVTFDDISDPKSVRLVDPDDLAASFGPGVRLKAVTVEATSEPVTEGRVEAVLGWLGNTWPNRLDGARYGTARTDNPFANSLSANSFSTEIRK